MKKEIVSFNETVPEMSKLLEIDGADLDAVTGGYIEGDLENNCGKLTDCGTYDSICVVNK